MISEVAAAVVVDVMALGGDEKVTPLHEAVSRNKVDLVQKFLSIITQKSEVFPPVRQVLEMRTKEGNNALQLSTSDEMKNLVESYLSPSETLLPIRINDDNVFALRIFMAQYVSEFSLHYVRDVLKKRAIMRYSEDGGKRKMTTPEAMAYNFARKDVIEAQDLRTFNDLIGGDYEFSKNVECFLKVFTSRRSKR